MEQQTNHAIGLGVGFGNESAEHLGQRAEEYCAYERERITLVNESRINVLRIAGAHVTEQIKHLDQRVRAAATAEKQSRWRRRKVFYWTTAAILAIAAFWFAVIGFAPFRLGFAGDLYCLGIAVVTPFAIEEFLDSWSNERLARSIVTLVFFTALLSGSLLAAIRGELLARQLQPTESAAAIDEAQPVTPEKNTFYDSTASQLRWLLVFLALGIDLGAGIAVHRALAAPDSGDDHDTLVQRLEVERLRLAGIVGEMIELENEPAKFVATFWRDFYRATLTQLARKAARKSVWLPVGLLLFFGVRDQIAAQTRTETVVALDLSRSEAVRGSDHISQFDKNRRGVDRLIGILPAGSRLTIIGITEQSFSDPLIILRANLSSDPGYFGERIAEGRKQIIRAWHGRSARLAPTSKHTDIFGAVRLASVLLDRSGDDSLKVLILYSDMRHSTRDLDFEKEITVGLVPVLTKRQLIPSLRGTAVYALGVTGVGHSETEWLSLNDFWSKYFTAAGADLNTYSSVTDPPRSILGSATNLAQGELSRRP